MTTPANNPGEQPGPATVNAEPAGAQPQDQQSAPTSFDQYDSDTLLAAITGEPVAEVPKQPEEAPKPDPNAQAPDGEQEQEQEEEEQPQGDPPASQEAGDKPPGRISVRALPPEQQLETAQAMDMVRRGEAKDLLDAIQQIRGTNPSDQPAPKQEQASQEEEQEQEQPQQATDVSAIEQEIRDLRAQRVAANKEFDTDSVEEITEKIEDALVRLSDAKIAATFQARQQAEQVASYEEKYNSAVDELERMYPDVLDDNSVMTRLLDDKVTAAQARRDPALQDPRYILKFASEVAELIGTKAAKTAPTTPSAKVPAPPAAPRRGTAEGLAPAHATAVRHSQDQIKALIESASVDDMLDALAATS